MTSPDFIDFQVATRNTAIYPHAQEGDYHALQYAALGMVGEAGEVAGKVKKIYRDKGGEISEYDRIELSKEVGDVLWYLARIVDELGLNFNEVAQENIDKLNSRQQRGVLQGSGDNR